MNFKKHQPQTTSRPFIPVNTPTQDREMERILENIVNSTHLNIPTTHTIQVSKKEIENQYLEATYSRIIDKPQNMSDTKAKALAVFYTDLAAADIFGPISIKRLYSFLEEDIKSFSSEMYSDIKRFYGLDEETPLSSTEEKLLSKKVEQHLEKIRSIKNALKYSYAFEESAKRMVNKLVAPSEMTFLEKVKWLRLWAIVIKDHEFFWGDTDENYNILGKKATDAFNELYLFPEAMISLEKTFFSRLKDGCILQERMQKFIELYPYQVQKAVYRFAELDRDEPDITQMGKIREHIKKTLFSKIWLTRASSFMTIEGLKHFTPETLEMAIKAYMNGGLNTLPIFRAEHYDVFKGAKRIYTFYKLGDFTYKGKNLELGISCKEELMMFVYTYQWFLSHPDFKFGDKQKTIYEYGLDSLMYDKKTAISSWILENGYAISEKDINWELAETILRLEENKELFQRYYNGEITNNDILSYIGFKDSKTAQICCSFNGLLQLDKAPLEAALKRLKIFGVENGLKSDKIYLELYKFLVKTDLPCGNKKKPISKYGIRYQF